jgi:hypothetical protein
MWCLPYDDDGLKSLNRNHANLSFQIHMMSYVEHRVHSKECCLHGKDSN